MANDQLPNNFTLHGIVVAALAVSGTLYFYHNPPLHTARPEITETQLHEMASRQQIEARSWQDPFAAIAKAALAKNAPESKGADAEDRGKCENYNFKEELRSRDGDAHPDVLAVMLPGGPYAELSEVRRRTRYAVLSGLETRGFFEKAQDRIGCWTPDDTEDNYIPREIPFEWFYKNNYENYRLLVLWLNEDIFVEKPLTGISNVLARLGTTRNSTIKIVGPYTSDALESMVKEAPHPPNWCPQDHASPNQTSEVSRDRLGTSHKRASRQAGVTLPNHSLRFHARPSPGSEVVEGLSISLQQRVSKQGRVSLAQAGPPFNETPEQTSGSADCQKNGWEQLKRVSFYSYGATTDETQLPGYSPDRKLKAFFFSEKGVDFQRWIATDRDLADGIARELDLRGIHLGMPDPKTKLVTDHVALISEWDTIYGRTIAPTMIREFEEKNGGIEKDPRCKEYQGPDNYRPNQCPWAHEFKYLRGLDGALPRSDEEDKQGNKQTKEEGVTDEATATMRDRAKAKADEDAFDRPQGQGQQDYLRRLAKSLVEKDKKLQAEGKGRIRAIGVLGNDVFDKLLILRALKPKFPRALFFTTDFDYTLTMPSELGWTRNLLIASSFGPKLDDERQSQIPPFRGSYETSAFLATQLAIDGIEREDTCLTPRIFEIERTGEVLQLPANKGAEAQECAKMLSGISTIQPSDEPIYPKPRGLKWLAVLLGIPIAASLFYLLGPARNQSKENNKRGFIVQHVEAISIFMVLFAAACLSAFWVRLANKLTSDGEPIVFLGGVSLWPPILLRILTITMAICLIGRGWRKLYDNLDQIAAEIGLARPKVVIRAMRALQKRNKLDWIDQFLGSFTSAAVFHRCVGKEYFDVKRGWVELVFQERYLARCARIIVFTMIMLFAFIVFSELTEFPYTPSRGEFASKLYLKFTFLDVLSMLVLVFTVADATFSFWLFVRELGPCQSKWPAKTKTKYSNGMKMYASDPHLDYWIDIDFIAKRTACIGELIYYPFVVVAMMIISRSTVFANFELNWPIMITQGICLGILIICALTLRQAAERARASARKVITVGAISENRAKAGKLEALLRRVDELQDGAFRPITQQAPVRALLLPLASIGLTALTEYGLIPL